MLPAPKRSCKISKKVIQFIINGAADTLSNSEGSWLWTRASVKLFELGIHTPGDLLYAYGTPGYWFSAFLYAKPSDFWHNFRHTRSKYARVCIDYWVINYWWRVNLIDQIDTEIIMKVMQSGRQTARRLIFFRCTCMLAILLWAYSYARPSNFGHFGQILWRIICPYAH